jgi:hypothetical protein
MKKALPAALVTAALILAGCTTTDLSTNKVGWSNYAEIAVKDFETLGIITVESQEVVIASFLGINKNRRGSRVVWSDLMAEAAKLGADDIINVRIDVVDQNTRTPLDFIIGWTHTYNYKGTALAIKYTEAVTTTVEKEHRQATTTINLPGPPDHDIPWIK